MCINFHTSDQIVSQVGSSIGIHQLLARIHTSLDIIALYHIYIYILYIIINITSDYRTSRTSGPRFQDSSRSTPGEALRFFQVASSLFGTYCNDDATVRFSLSSLGEFTLAQHRMAMQGRSTRSTGCWAKNVGTNVGTIDGSNSNPNGP